MNEHGAAHYGLRPGAERFPLMVVLAVAYRCNARCPHCPYTNSTIRDQYRDAPFIADDLFRRVADECGQYGAYLRITGGGEPFLHPRMTELAEYARKAGARLGLITNGSRLSEERLVRLIAAGVDAIEFSVDAADADTYARVRPGLDWDNLVRTVETAVRLRDRHRGRTNILASVVHQDVVADQIDRIVAFWEARCDHVIKRKFLTWGDQTRLSPEHSGDPAPYLEEGVPCPFIFERLNIDTRGDVAVCGFDIAGRSRFGNVRQQTIASIWQGPRFRRWRQWHLAGRAGRLPLCARCPDWRYRSWTHNYWKSFGTAEARRQARLRRLDEQDMEGHVLMGQAGR